MRIEINATGVTPSGTTVKIHEDEEGYITHGSWKGTGVVEVCDGVLDISVPSADVAGPLRDLRSADDVAAAALALRARVLDVVEKSTGISASFLRQVKAAIGNAYHNGVRAGADAAKSDMRKALGL